jgi:hypothetical protein
MRNQELCRVKVKGKRVKGLGIVISTQILEVQDRFPREIDQMN